VTGTDVIALWRTMQTRQFDGKRGERTIEGCMDASVRFSREIHGKMSEMTRSTMVFCEGSAARLGTALDQMTEHFLIPARGDVRDVHNNYVRAILASTSAKHVAHDHLDRGGE
jgi:hypothetical protein